jgi:hypothetical protein
MSKHLQADGVWTVTSEHFKVWRDCSYGFAYNVILWLA